MDERFDAALDVENRTLGFDRVNDSRNRPSIPVLGGVYMKS